MKNKHMNPCQHEDYHHTHMIPISLLKRPQLQASSRHRLNKQSSLSLLQQTFCILPAISFYSLKINKQSNISIMTSSATILLQLGKKQNDIWLQNYLQDIFFSPVIHIVQDISHVHKVSKMHCILNMLIKSEELLLLFSDRVLSSADRSHMMSRI